MFKLLMLPVTIAMMSAKMTLGVFKWILQYRIGKVVVGCSLVTAAIQHLGYRMSNPEEILIITVVGLIATVILIGPRLWSWWQHRREKHDMDKKQRQARGRP